MPEKYPTVSFRLTGRMEADLAERTAEGKTQHSTAKNDLERYHELLRRDLRTVKLSRAEVMLMLDATNGTHWDHSSIPLLWSEVEDSLEDGLGDKWQVDGPTLVSTLQRLTPGQCFAVVDAMERARLAGIAALSAVWPGLKGEG